MPHEAGIAVGDRKVALAPAHSIPGVSSAAQAPVALTVMPAEMRRAVRELDARRPRSRRPAAGTERRRDFAQEVRAPRTADRPSNRPAPAGRPRGPGAVRLRLGELPRVQHFHAHRAAQSASLRRHSAISSSSAATQIVPHGRYSTSRGKLRDHLRSRARASSAVRASCAGESSITTTCPMPAAVAPPPIGPGSTTATESPRGRARIAQAAPTMPAAGDRYVEACAHAPRIP